MSLALNPAVSKNRKTDNLRSNKISYKFDPRRLSKKLDEHEKIFSKKSKDYTEILNKQNKDYIQEETVETFTTDTNYIIASLNLIIKNPGSPVPPPDDRNNSNIKIYIAEELKDKISFVTEPDIHRLMYEYNKKRTRYLEYQRRLKNSIMMDDIAIISAKVLYIAAKWFIQYHINIWVGGMFIKMFNNWEWFSSPIMMNSFYSFLSLNNIVPPAYLFRIKALIVNVKKDFEKYRSLISNTTPNVNDAWKKFIRFNGIDGAPTAFDFLRSGKDPNPIKWDSKGDLLAYLTEYSGNSKLEKSFLTKMASRTKDKLTKAGKWFHLGKSWITGSPLVNGVALTDKQLNDKFILDVFAGNLPAEAITSKLIGNKDLSESITAYIKDNKVFQSFKPNPVFLLEKYYKTTPGGNILLKATQQFSTGNLFELGKMFSLLTNCYMPGTSSVETTFNALSDVFNNPLTFKRMSRSSSMNTELGNFLKQDFKLSTIKFINSREISTIIPFFGWADQGLQKLPGFLGSSITWTNKNLGITVDNISKLLFTNMVNEMFKNPEYKSERLEKDLKYAKFNENLEKRRKLYRKSKSYEKIEQELSSGKYNDEHKYKSKVFQFFEDRFRGRNFSTTSKASILVFGSLAVACSWEGLVLASQVFISMDTTILIKLFICFGEFISFADRNQITTWVNMLLEIIQGKNAALLLMTKIFSDIFSDNTPTFFGMPKIKAQRLATKALTMIKNEIMTMISDLKISIGDASAFMASKSEIFESFIHNNIVEVLLKILGIITDLFITCSTNHFFREMEMNATQFIQATDFTKFINNISIDKLIGAIENIATRGTLLLYIRDLLYGKPQEQTESLKVLDSLMRKEYSTNDYSPKVGDPRIGTNAVIMGDQKSDSVFLSTWIDPVISLLDEDMLTRMKTRLSVTSSFKKGETVIYVVGPCDGDECLLSPNEGMAPPLKNPEKMVFHLSIIDFLNLDEIDTILNQADLVIKTDREGKRTTEIPAFSEDFSEKFRIYLNNKKNVSNEVMSKLIDNILAKDTAYWVNNFYGSSIDGESQLYLDADGLIDKIDLHIAAYDKLEKNKGTSASNTPISGTPSLSGIKEGRKKLIALKREIQQLFKKEPRLSEQSIKTKLGVLIDEYENINPPTVVTTEEGWFSAIWGDIKSLQRIVYDSIADSVLGKKTSLPNQHVGTIMLQLIESLSFKKTFTTIYGEAVVGAKDIMIDDTFIVGPASIESIDTEDCNTLTSDKKTVTDLMKLIIHIHSWNKYSMSSDEKTLHIDLGKCSPGEIIKVLLEAGLNTEVLDKGTIKFRVSKEREKELDRSQSNNIPDIYREWKSLTDSLNDSPLLFTRNKTDHDLKIQSIKSLEKKWTELTTRQMGDGKSTYKYISDPIYEYMYGPNKLYYSVNQNQPIWVGSDKLSPGNQPSHLKFVYGGERGQALTLSSLDISQMFYKDARRVKCSEVGIITTREVIMRNPLSGTTKRVAISYTEPACSFSANRGRRIGSKSLFDQIDSYKNKYKGFKQRQWLEAREKDLNIHLTAREKLFDNIPILMSNFNVIKWANGPFSPFSHEQKYGLSNFNKVWRDIEAKDNHQELVNLWKDVKKCSNTAGGHSTKSPEFNGVSIDDKQINKFTLTFILFNKPILDEISKCNNSKLKKAIKKLFKSTSGGKEFTDLGKIDNLEEFRTDFSKQLIQEFINGWGDSDDNGKVFTDEKKYKDYLNKYELCKNSNNPVCDSPPFYLKPNHEYEENNKKYFGGLYSNKENGGSKEFMSFLTLVRTASSNYELSRWEMGYNIDMLKALGVTGKNQNYSDTQISALTSYFRNTPDISKQTDEELYTYIFTNFQKNNGVISNIMGESLKGVAIEFGLKREREAANDKILKIITVCLKTGSSVGDCDKSKIKEIYKGFVTTLETKIYESGDISEDKDKFFEVLEKIVIQDANIDIIMRDIMSTIARWDNEDELAREAAAAAAGFSTGGTTGSGGQSDARDGYTAPTKSDSSNSKKNVDRRSGGEGVQFSDKGETRYESGKNVPYSTPEVVSVGEIKGETTTIKNADLLSTKISEKLREDTKYIIDTINDLLEKLNNMFLNKFLEQLKNLLKMMFSSISDAINGQGGNWGYTYDTSKVSNPESITDVSKKNKINISNSQKNQICKDFINTYVVHSSREDGVIKPKAYFDNHQTAFAVALDLFNNKNIDSNLTSENIKDIINTGCIKTNLYNKFQDTANAGKANLNKGFSLIESLGRLQWYTAGAKATLRQLVDIGIDSYAELLIPSLGVATGSLIACIISGGSLCALISTLAGPASAAAFAVAAAHAYSRINIKLTELGLGDIKTLGRSFKEAAKGVMDNSIDIERNSMSFIQTFNRNFIDIMGVEITEENFSDDSDIIYYNGVKLEKGTDWIIEGTQPERCIRIKIGISTNELDESANNKLCKKLSEFKYLPTQRIDMNAKITAWKNEGIIGRKKLFKLLDLYQSLSSPEFEGILSMVGQEAFHQMSSSSYGVGIEHTLLKKDSVFMSGVKELWGLPAANLNELLNKKPSTLNTYADRQTIDYYIQGGNWKFYEKSGDTSLLGTAEGIFDIAGIFANSDLSGEWSGFKDDLSGLMSNIKVDLKEAVAKGLSKDTFTDIVGTIEDEFREFNNLFGFSAFIDGLKSLYTGRRPYPDAIDQPSNEKIMRSFGNLVDSFKKHKESLNKLSTKFRCMAIKIATNSNRPDSGITKSTASYIFGKDTMLTFLVGQIQESYKMENQKDLSLKTSLNDEINIIYGEDSLQDSGTIFTATDKIQEYFYKRMSLQICSQYVRTPRLKQVLSGVFNNAIAMPINMIRGQLYIMETMVRGIGSFILPITPVQRSDPLTLLAQRTLRDIMSNSYPNDRTILKPKVGNLIINSFTPTCIDVISPDGTPDPTHTAIKKKEILLQDIIAMEVDNPGLKKFLCNTVYYEVAAQTPDTYKFAEGTESLLYSATWKSICPQVKKSNIIASPGYMVEGDDGKMVHILEYFLSSLPGQTDNDRAKKFKNDMEQSPTNLWNRVITQDNLDKFSEMIGTPNKFKLNTIKPEDAVDIFIIMFDWEISKKASLQQIPFFNQIEKNKFPEIDLGGTEQEKAESLFDANKKFILKTPKPKLKFSESFLSYVKKKIFRHINREEQNNVQPNMWVDFVKNSVDVGNGIVKGIPGVPGNEKIIETTFGKSNPWTFIYLGGFNGEPYAINKNFNKNTKLPLNTGDDSKQYLMELNEILNKLKEPDTTGDIPESELATFKAFVKESIDYLYPGNGKTKTEFDAVISTSLGRIDKRSIANAGQVFFKEVMFDIITELQIKDGQEAVSCSGSSKKNCKMDYISSHSEMFNLMEKNNSWSRYISQGGNPDVTMFFKATKSGTEYNINGFALDERLWDESQKMMGEKASAKNFIDIFWREGPPYNIAELKENISGLKYIGGNVPVTNFNIIKQYSTTGQVDIFDKIVDMISKNKKVYTKSELLEETERILKLFYPQKTDIFDDDVKTRIIEIFDEKMKRFTSEVSKVHQENIAYINDYENKPWKYSDVCRDTTSKLKKVYTDYNTVYPTGDNKYCNFDSLDGAESWDIAKIQTFMETQKKLLVFPPKPEYIADDLVWGDSITDDAYKILRGNLLNSIIIPPLIKKRSHNIITILGNQVSDETFKSILNLGTIDIISINTDLIELLSITKPGTVTSELPITGNTVFEEYFGESLINGMVDTITTPETYKLVSDSIEIILTNFNPPPNNDMVFNKKYLLQFGEKTKELKNKLKNKIIENLASIEEPTDDNLKVAKMKLGYMGYTDEDIKDFLKETETKSAQKAAEKKQETISEIIIQVLMGDIELSDVNNKLNSKGLGSIIFKVDGVLSKNKCLIELEKLCKAANITNICIDKKLFFKKKTSEILEFNKEDNYDETLKKLNRVGWSESGAARLIDLLKEYRIRMSKLTHYLEKKDLKIIIDDGVALFDKIKMSRIKLKDSRTGKIGANFFGWGGNDKKLNIEIILGRVGNTNKWVSSNLKNKKGVHLYKLTYEVDDYFDNPRGPWRKSSIPSVETVYEMKELTTEEKETDETAGIDEEKEADESEIIDKQQSGVNGKWGIHPGGKVHYEIHPDDFKHYKWLSFPGNGKVVTSQVDTTEKLWFYSVDGRQYATNDLAEYNLTRGPPTNKVLEVIVPERLIKLLPKSGGGIDINTNIYNNSPKINITTSNDDLDNNCTIV